MALARRLASTPSTSASRGAFVPNEDARREVIPGALAALDSDVVCLQEVWTQADKDAITAALAGTFPHAVSFTHDLDTPVDDPTDQNGDVASSSHGATLRGPGAHGVSGQRGDLCRGELLHHRGQRRGDDHQHRVCPDRVHRGGDQPPGERPRGPPVLRLSGLQPSDRDPRGDARAVHHRGERGAGLSGTERRDDRLQAPAVGGRRFRDARELEPPGGGPRRR